MSEKVVKRSSIKNKTYREILDVETHHKHIIIKDSSGTLRWKENNAVRESLKKIDLNDLMELLYSMEYTRNSEVVRKLYRDMGYSLFGYWEVFFWEINNDDAPNYKPKKE